MKIQMTNWFVKDMSLKSKQTNESNKRAKENDHFSFAYGSALQPDGSSFQIGFKVSVDNPHFILNLEVIYNFNTDQVITSDFANSDFLKINAPAIAFPYLRSLISTITLQSGFQCVILPSVNFVALNKKGKKD